MRIAAGAAFGLLGLLAAPIASADMLDIAIEVIKPELKPAKPVLMCVIGGKAILECAKAQGRAELANEPRVQDILEAYGYAKDKQWAKLVAKVGVTAACTAFDIPAKAIFCDEYSKYVVQYGAKIVEGHAAVAKEVGGVVTSLVKEGAAVLTCAVGFSCPSSGDDPNSYVVTMPGGAKFSIRKFNLDQMWSECYATRVEEGISSRIANPAKFKRMVASPSTRLGNTMVLDEDALGRGCIVKLEVEAGLDYYERQQGIYARGWDPFAAQMNPRWRDMIFTATAETLSHPADLFLKSSDNWLKLRSVVTAQNRWDAPILQSVYAGELAECARAVELPASSVAMWSDNAAATGDGTALEGVPGAQWSGKIRGWCEREYKPVLVAKIETRLQAKAKAIAGGCSPRPEGGLSCPTLNSGSYALSALDQCKIAYSGRADSCSAFAPRVSAPATSSQPITTPPAAPPGRTIGIPRVTPAPVTPETSPQPPSPPTVLPTPRIRVPASPSPGGS